MRRYFSNLKLFVPIGPVVFGVLCLIVALDGADAYTYAGVPLPWLAMFLATPLLLVYATFSPLRAPPGLALYLVLLCWMLGNTIVMSMRTDYSADMPAMATTSYPTFVFLRGYAFFGFLFLSIVVFNYARQASPDKLLNVVTVLGILVTLYAVYVLLAQRLQLPMIPKTRFGTGEGGVIAGGETGYFGDATERYLFRTIGSFREPSFLGIWLIVPFFLSIAAAGGKVLNWRSIFIGLGILSTGSLTAAVAVVAGFLGALALVQPLSKRGLKIVGAIALAAVILGLVINTVARMYLDTPADLSFADQYLERLERLSTGGVQTTNRSYAFKKFIDSEFSLYGEGMGNAHLVNSRDAAVTVSFLSLYIHIWFAGGAIGLTLLLLYLFLPLLAVLLRARQNRFDNVWFVAPYVAWLVVFIANDENLNVMISLAAGLLWARLVPLNRRQPQPLPMAAAPSPAQ